MSLHLAHLPSQTASAGCTYSAQSVQGQSPKSAASSKGSGPHRFRPSPGKGPSSQPLRPGLLEPRDCAPCGLLRLPHPRVPGLRTLGTRLRGTERPAQSIFFPYPNLSRFSHDPIFLHLPVAALAGTTPAAFPASGAPDPQPQLWHRLVPPWSSSSVLLDPSIPGGLSPYLPKGLSLSLSEADCLQQRLHRSGGADRVGVWGGHLVSLLEPYQQNRSSCSGLRLEFRPG